jgi:protein SCO1/2
MRLNTILGIIVCALLPIFSYFIVKNYTDNNVKFPRRYFIDDVKEKTLNGKITTDTIYHRIKNFKMVNQFGDTVQIDQLRGKVLMVNFFFASCPSICPKTTNNLVKVQKAIGKDTAIHMISITIDPKNDSTKRLRKYAEDYGIKHDNWWLGKIVGDSLESIMLEEFKAAFKDSAGVLDHKTDVYLLDKNRVVRGKHVIPEITEERPVISRFYDSHDTTDMLQIVNDAAMLKMEKTQRSKPPFFIIIASTAIMGLVFAYVLFVRKRDKNALKIK